jgi:hypothetical protein
VLDAVRVKFPAGYSIESTPTSGQVPLKEKGNDGKETMAALCELKTESTPNSVTVRRNLIMGELIFPKEQYSNVHTFFTNFETRDHEPTVLKLAAQTASN